MNLPPKYLPLVCTCAPPVNGAWLAAVRAGAGISRASMARRLHMSVWTLKDVERNRRACRPWLQRAYEALAGER